MTRIEEWRQYLDTEYYTSNLGRVKGPHGILKPYPNTSGYLQVGVYHERGKRIKTFLSKMVATSWVDNPNNFKFVHHKDENPSNNCPDNLEWVATQGHQEKRSERLKALNRERRSKNIAQIDGDSGDIIHIWTREELKNDESFHYPYILRACKSGYRHRGYYWKYIASNQ